MKLTICLEDLFRAVKWICWSEEPASQEGEEPSLGARAAGKNQLGLGLLRRQTGNQYQLGSLQESFTLSDFLAHRKKVCWQPEAWLVPNILLLSVDFTIFTSIIPIFWDLKNPAYVG